MMTKRGRAPKLIAFQMADVHKALLSFIRAADAGSERHDDAIGGYLLDTVTGEEPPIVKRGTFIR